MGDAMKFVKSLYVQILFAVVLGVLVGHFLVATGCCLEAAG
jgi:Na+/H+-dicarboxylate symporter